MAQSRPEPIARRLAWMSWLAGQVPVQRRFPFRSPEGIERVQRRRVQAAVAHAYAHVPYYRETMRTLGLGPAELRTAADLARLPVLEREQVQRDPERFVSEALERERRVLLATEGSTGAPLLVYHDPFSLFQNAAVYQRREAAVARMAGRRLRLRRARIESPLGLAARSGAQLDRLGPLASRLRNPELWISRTDPPERIAAQLADFRPDVLISRGAVLEALYADLRRTGRGSVFPAVLVYGGEPMLPSARRAMKDEHGIRFSNGYGAGEAHHIAWECEHQDALHANVDVCPLRIVDPDGRDVPPGDPGDILISNLLNRGTMLLNYRLGDRARWLEQRCGCGRSLPLLAFPDGRVGEWVRGPSGKVHHGQEVRGLLLVDDRHLLRFLIEQQAPARFLVKVVVTAECDREAFQAGVVRRFAELFGAETRTEVVFVDSLPRRIEGKQRTVIGLPLGTPQGVA